MRWFDRSSGGKYLEAFIHQRKKKEFLPTIGPQYRISFYRCDRQCSAAAPKPRTWLTQPLVWNSPGEIAESIYIKFVVYNVPAFGSLPLLYLLTVLVYPVPTGLARCRWWILKPLREQEQERICRSPVVLSYLMTRVYGRNIYVHRPRYIRTSNGAADVNLSYTHISASTPPLLLPNSTPVSNPYFQTLRADPFLFLSFPINYYYYYYFP